MNQISDRTRGYILPVHGKVKIHLRSNFQALINLSFLHFRSLEIIHHKDYHVGDENGVFSIALNHDGDYAAIGLGSGSFAVRIFI